MDRLTENAKAKVNLSLRVLGRRDDGYHQIESLVAFSDLGDRLTLDPGPAFSLAVDGPFADCLEGQNLVERTVEYFDLAYPDSRTGAFRLKKSIPVAAGLGGGSADAAAALRLLARANGDKGLERELSDLAQSLGADVSVCLNSRVAMISGIGERVDAVAHFPQLFAVLVNPGVKLSARDVFGALEAPAYEATADDEPPAPPPLQSVDTLLEHLTAAGNDLEVVALELVPKIGDVQQALRNTWGCLVVRLSGSGPTSFGLYRDKRYASVAAAKIGLNPDWWVTETTLG